jgi:hypothetical protein
MKARLLFDMRDIVQPRRVKCFRDEGNQQPDIGYGVSFAGFTETLERIAIHRLNCVSLDNSVGNLAADFEAHPPHGFLLTEIFVSDKIRTDESIFRYTGPQREY